MPGGMLGMCKARTVGQRTSDSVREGIWKDGMPCSLALSRAERLTCSSWRVPERGLGEVLHDIVDAIGGAEESRQRFHHDTCRVSHRWERR